MMTLWKSFTSHNKEVVKIKAAALLKFISGYADNEILEFSKKELLKLGQKAQNFEEVYQNSELSETDMKQFCENIMKILVSSNLNAKEFFASAAKYTVNCISSKVNK